MAEKQNYSAENIQVLEGLEAVRKRPGMYIGSTDVRGLHHLLWEIVDNAIDEAMAGYCDNIEIVMQADGGVRVSDNGRGIPVDTHSKTGKSALETVMTILHAGGKFGGGGYKVSGGLHGVGASVVNALAEKVVATVKRDGKLHRQEYARGAVVTPIEVVGEASDTGTEIVFYPDPQIFKETTSMEWDTILTRLRQQAYLTKGVRIAIADETGEKPKRHAFFFDGGVASYVRHLSENKVSISEVIAVERETEACQLEVAMRYTDSYTENIWCFTNHIHNPEGGTHLTGFRTALTRTINAYARDKQMLKEKEDNFVAEDVREGLTAVLSIKVAEPQFEGQTKGKLGNSEVRPAVEAAFAEAFTEYLEENPNEARAVIGKCLLAARARKAARAARDTVIRKGALEGMTLPGKLADCSSKNAEETEIFIVEGDSAGGSAKQGRNRDFQAILPLRGKILNVEQARLDKMLNNNEVKALITALGTGIGDIFEAEKLRYGKVVIMTDADVDGAHIRTLLLTLFYRYFREIVDNGNLYIACPPLYKVAKGKDVRYAYDEVEKLNILKDMGIEDEAEEIEENEEENGNEEEETATKKKSNRVSIQRYKGLGEMNPDQLWETTMDPDMRTMMQVTIEDAERSDLVFTTLMGSEVLPRKKFIQTHAKSVKNLDI